MGYFKTTPAGTGDLGKFGSGVDADLMLNGNRAQRRFFAKFSRDLARKEAISELRRKKANPK